MQRLVQPEILDRLPPGDPEARRSRADLRRINRLMGNGRILRREIGRLPFHPRRIVEIGAGEGTLMLPVLRAVPHEGETGTIVFHDLRDLVTERTRHAYRESGWIAEVRAGDVFRTLESADLVVANLFLHHFEDPALAALLERIGKCSRAFLAIEPRRSRIGLLGASLVGAIGCNRVTRHDAVASVRAGFGDRELSSLWPYREGWFLREEAVAPFSHLFLARSTA